MNCLPAKPLTGCFSIPSCGIVKVSSGAGAVSGFFGLPAPRHEFLDAINLVIGQAVENPFMPSFQIDV